MTLFHLIKQSDEKPKGNINEGNNSTAIPIERIFPTGKTKFQSILRQRNDLFDLRKDRIGHLEGY